jgi:hypothetical protein
MVDELWMSLSASSFKPLSTKAKAVDAWNPAIGYCCSSSRNGNWGSPSEDVGMY